VNGESSGNNNTGNNNTGNKNGSGSNGGKVALTGSRKWQFIDTGFRSGVYNMELDMKLVESCKNDDTAYLRFYRWKPYAISLGYNQTRLSKEAYIDINKCRADGMDIVTRPTGGRAVLHSEELTYSVIFRSVKPIHELYRDISEAIVNGLKLINPAFNKLSFTKDTPDMLNLIRTGMYNLCFNSAIKNEINFKGKKLVGSAQRKFGDIVLQHGSILIGNHHKNIVNYLNINGEERIKMLKEIEDKTDCLNNIAGRNISYSETAEAVFKGFKETFGISFSSINRVAEFLEPRMQAKHILN
jgi:lipoate-protein ligase A